LRPSHGVDLSGRQIRVLERLATARGPFTRRMLAEQLFDAKRVDFRPVLGPLLAADLVRRREINGYGRTTEEAFIITDAGREALGALRTPTGGSG
jgi:hypothetical protein